MKNRTCSYVYESGEGVWPPASRPRLLRIALPALVARCQHGGRHRGARPPHRVQILRQEAPRQRPLQDPLHPRTERREEYGPPDALQRLPAIINFSGGRSSAFMLYHLLEHDDGRLQAKRPWSQATLWQQPWPEIRHVPPPPLTNGHSLSTADLRFETP